MGIPYYFSYIIKNYPNILINRKNFNKQIDYLLIDSNSIVYDSFHEMDEFPKQLQFEFESQLISNVIDKISQLISIINPFKKTYIAFDGVAPIAKMDQQRSRRYKSEYQKQITNQLALKHKVSIKNKSWSTCNITPGTAFMNKLNSAIRSKFSSNSNIIFSGSDEPGEGEHKIFEILRQNNYTGDNVTIYGLDADLIMLSLGHRKFCKEINLWRETPDFIRSLDADLNPEEVYLLSVDNLAEQTIVYLKNIIDTEDVDYYKAMNDYIFICFLMGNDFLPHFPALNIRTGGLDKVVIAYKSIMKSKMYITNNSKINWSNFSKFIEFLSLNEAKYIQEEYKLRNKKEKQKPKISGSYEDDFKKFELSPTYDRITEHFINPLENYWQKRYYLSLFNIKHDDHYIKRKRVSMNYLEGLEWNLKYYTQGCIDWSWRYKFDYPPLLEDLIKFIPSNNTDLLQLNNSSPVSEIVQLAYVLPQQHLNLLPPKQRNIIYTHLGDSYRTDWMFCNAFCKYFWESHVLMDEIDIDKLKMVIK